MIEKTMSKSGDGTKGGRLIFSVCGAVNLLGGMMSSPNFYKADGPWSFAAMMAVLKGPLALACDKDNIRTIRV